MQHGGVKRVTEVERARRKRRSRALVAGFFLFIGSIVFLESPLTRVRSVEVSGNTAIPSDKLVKESEVHSGMSLWQVNGSAVEHAIMSSEPLVQAVTVHTDYLNGLVSLKIEQKHIVALYEFSGKFYRLLDDGVVYDEVPAQDGFSWPIVTADTTSQPSVGHTPSNAFISALCQQLELFSDKSEMSHISELHLDHYGVVTAYLDSGFAVAAKVGDLSSNFAQIKQVVQYFTSKGYGPGLIDMTGAAPYRFTPFVKSDNKGGHP